MRLPEFVVRGIPEEADPTEAALLRSRLLTAAKSFRTAMDVPSGITLVVSDQPTPPANDRTSGPDGDTLSLEDRASFYRAVDPYYTFDALVLPEQTMERLLNAVATVTLRKEIFEGWNLRSIEPNPSVALNFHGAPGTGKTLAAHAVADRLGRRVICTKYSQLESKYHGEGPKNLDALFHAARTQDAVLFLDEADSLMSRRFESISQGSEHAINSMRSELLQSLDGFDGVVIFASNFVESYDTAFDSRVRHVFFPSPDLDARARIWKRMLVPELPLAGDVSLQDLAAVEDVSGREIRTAVIEAATQTRLRGLPAVTGGALLEAIENVKRERVSRPGRRQGAPVPTGSAEEKKLQEAALRAITSGTDPKEETE